MTRWVSRWRLLIISFSSKTITWCNLDSSNRKKIFRNLLQVYKLSLYKLFRRIFVFSNANKCTIILLYSYQFFSSKDYLVLLQTIWHLSTNLKVYYLFSDQQYHLALRRIFHISLNRVIYIYSYQIYLPKYVIRHRWLSN